MSIPMTSVKSSQIDALGHSGEVMHVRFNSGVTYSYQNVPQELYEKLLTAPSIGKAFGELIKSNLVKYPYTKLKA